MNRFLKKVAFIVAVCGSFASFAQAKGDSLEAQVRKTVNDNLPICCLPVWDDTADLDGYCYRAENGFVAGRIEDDALRNYANSHVTKYPICKDSWCWFERTKGNPRYLRTDSNGQVLMHGKFEKDLIGVFYVIPALEVRRDLNLILNSNILNVRDVPECKVDVDFNVELIGKICVVRSNKDGSVSFISRDEAGEAVADWENENYDGFSVFYTDMNSIAGVMDKRFIPILMKSKANTSVSNCLAGSNENRLRELGFTVK